MNRKVSAALPNAHFQALQELGRLATRHRQLTWEMTRREISERYAGQMIGSLWALGHPLALMMVYVFVFGVVFKARAGGTSALPLNYAIYLLSALIPWLAFQESMSKGAVVIVGNGNLVKQVVFPLEILPMKGVLASMITQMITTALLMGYVLVVNRTLTWTWLLLPVLWFFQLLAMAGVSYALSAVGTFFRDTKDLVQISAMIGMYLMPVVYLPEMVPEKLRFFLWLNPFSYMAWCFQDVCFFGSIQHPWAWLVFPLGSLAGFYAGFRIFRKLKVYFGNVL